MNYNPIPYRRLGTMIDCSRNAVMKVETLKGTYNKKIFIIDQPLIDCEAFKTNMQKIMEIAGKNSSDGVVEFLRQMVPEFKTPEEVNREVEQGEEKETVTV